MTEQKLDKLFNVEDELLSTRKLIEPIQKDAIYLTDSSGAWGLFGHSAIALQDSNNRWYYISFQPVGINSHKVFSELNNKFEVVYANINIPNVALIFTELKDIKFGENNKSIISANYNYIGKKGNISGNISSYNHQIYIEGNFTNSIKKAQEYEKNPPRYWLTERNCSWLAIKILHESTIGNICKEIENLLYTKSILGIKQKNTLIPNFCHQNVKFIFEKAYKVTETILK